MTTSAWSYSRVPVECVGGTAFDWASDVTAITGRPRRRAPAAISMPLAPWPPALNTIITSGGQPEVGEDHLGEALDPLDEHGLTLAVGADDLGVERRRQFDDRVEPGIRAVRGTSPRRGSGCARAEQVDQPSAADRRGAARLLRRSPPTACSTSGRAGLARRRDPPPADTCLDNFRNVLSSPSARQRAAPSRHRDIEAHLRELIAAESPGDALRPRPSCAPASTSAG